MKGFLVTLILICLFPPTSSAARPDDQPENPKVPAKLPAMKKRIKVNFVDDSGTHETTVVVRTPLPLKEALEDQKEAEADVKDFQKTLVESKRIAPEGELRLLPQADVNVRAQRQDQRQDQSQDRIQNQIRDPIRVPIQKSAAAGAPPETTTATAPGLRPKLRVLPKKSPAALAAKLPKALPPRLTPPAARASPTPEVAVVVRPPSTEGATTPASTAAPTMTAPDAPPSPSRNDVGPVIVFMKSPAPPAVALPVPVPAPRPIPTAGPAAAPSLAMPAAGVATAPSVERDAPAPDDGRNAPGALAVRAVDSPDEPSHRLYLRSSYVDAHYANLESDLQNGASTFALGLARDFTAEGAVGLEARATIEIGHGLDQALTIQNTRFLALRADAVYSFLTGSLTPLASFGLGYLSYDVRSERAGADGDRSVVTTREHAHGAGLIAAPGLGARFKLGTTYVDLTAEYLAIVGGESSSSLGGVTAAIGLGLRF